MKSFLKITIHGENKKYKLYTQTACHCNEHRTSAWTHLLSQLREEAVVWERYKKLPWFMHAASHRLSSSFVLVKKKRKKASVEAAGASG